MKHIICWLPSEMCGGLIKERSARLHPRVSAALTWGLRPSISTKGSREEAILRALAQG